MIQKRLIEFMTIPEQLIIPKDKWLSTDRACFKSNTSRFLQFNFPQAALRQKQCITETNCSIFVAVFAINI